VNVPVVQVSQLPYTAAFGFPTSSSDAFENDVPDAILAISSSQHDQHLHNSWGEYNGPFPTCAFCQDEMKLGFSDRNESDVEGYLSSMAYGNTALSEAGLLRMDKVPQMLHTIQASAHSGTNSISCLRHCPRELS
jgi:hypothetical protein